MTNPDQLPSVGILTIIGPETRAVKAALGITERNRIVNGDGTLSYAITVDNDFIGPMRVLLWSIGTAGNTASAADSARLIGQGIKFLILCGIAGGMRGKVKIGDIVIPRAVVDTTVKVAEGGDRKPRPVITSPLKGVFQMNYAVEISVAASQKYRPSNRTGRGISRKRCRATISSRVCDIVRQSARS